MVEKYLLLKKLQGFYEKIQKTKLTKLIQLIQSLFPLYLGSGYKNLTVNRLDMFGHLFQILQKNIATFNEIIQLFHALYHLDQKVLNVKH